MKPAAFDYYRPLTIADAVAALGSSNDAKVLAGGQSLVPTMNFRLSLPSLLVDIRNVAGIGDIEVDSDGVSIGASVTQSRVMNSDEVISVVPGLRRALRLVGHLQIRNRGTVCGSLAHADPAAELPALAMATGARLMLHGPDGERAMDAGTFYLGPYWTELGRSEVITGVHFPAEPSGTVTMVDEIARRAGDFAIVGLVGAFDVEGGAVSGVRLVSFGVSGKSSRLPLAEEAIEGFHPGQADSGIYEAAFEDAADAVEDIHATARYRREALGALVARTARAAVEYNGDGTGE